MHIHAGWRELVLLIAAAPLVYYALATLAAWRFFSRERARVLPAFTPPVSILKPLRGVDFGSYENFSSFCQQGYPEYEILFAVNDENDAAIPVVRRIIEEFPEQKIRLLVGSEDIGANRKVNKLVRLAREAQHEILVLSDGDVRVKPSYLREVVAPFADKKIGAVTSFYRGIAENNFYAELEAIGASSDFFAGVLMANWMEGVRFALGASIATTKSWLAKAGGFESIAGMLADDYELGSRIARAGGSILLCQDPVWTMYPAQTARSFWDHQVRWSRTVRLCRPASYAGLIFTHGLPWAILGAILAPNGAFASAYLGGYLILRSLMAWAVGIWGVGDEILLRRLWMIPLRDAVHFVVWLSGLGSKRIRWAGIEYIIHKGRMVPVEPLDPDNH